MFEWNQGIEIGTNHFSNSKYYVSILYIITENRYIIGKFAYITNIIHSQISTSNNGKNKRKRNIK